MKAQSPWGPDPEQGLPEAENWRRVLAFREWFLVEERKSLKEGEHYVAEAERALVPKQALDAFRYAVRLNLDNIAATEKSIAELRAKLAAVASGAL